MTMPITTNGTRPSGKQRIAPDSFAEQRRRTQNLQSDLLRVVGAMGMSRSLLQRRDNWDNASRNPGEYQPYAPHDRLQTMVRDVVKTTANRGNDDDRRKVRAAVHAFYESLLLDALEFMGEEPEADVITLTLSSEKEISEAKCATLRAITSKCPEAHRTAGRETGEALSILARLKDALDHGARALHLRVVR